MALVEKTVLIPFSSAQMFTLVDNVADYPQFLPWCGGSSVNKVSEDTVHATVHIDYHFIKQSFTTKNVSDPPHRINIKLLDGPFQSLDGDWHFIALTPEACKIHFRLNYVFSSKLLEKALGPVFNHIANSFVESFIHRAEKVYAKHE
jgi:ribosome-associated toxin RatA of RatAB toxin-antitoxin module